MLNWCSMMHSCLEFLFVPKKMSFSTSYLDDEKWKSIYLLIMRSPLVTSSVFMLLSYKCKVSIFIKSTNHFLPIYNIWDSCGGYWPLLVLNSHIPFYRLPIPTFSKNIFAVFLNPKPINKRYLLVLRETYWLQFVAEILKVKHIVPTTTYKCIALQTLRNVSFSKTWIKFPL